MEDFIINEIKDLLRAAINKEAKKSGFDKLQVVLKLKMSDAEKLDIFWVYDYDFANQRSIEFGSLIGVAKKLMYAGIGFNVTEKAPMYIKQFIKNCCEDKQIEDITKPFFIICLTPKDGLAAFMYKSNTPEQVPLSYIIQTGKQKQETEV